MIDLNHLRQVIETTPEGRPAAIVSRRWLEQAERELLAARAASGPNHRQQGDLQ